MTLRSPFAGVSPLSSERAARLPGDDIVPAANVVMDRAFTLDAPVETVWPWFCQLGKGRAGWYLPARVERLLPAGRRALRWVDPALQALSVGDVIDDWGGRNATFEVAILTSPSTLVHRSRRGNTDLSWAIVLEPTNGSATRVQLRLRLGSVKHRRLASSVGDLIDLVTIAGLAAGLRERV
jgi:hypothetical protein